MQGATILYFSAINIYPDNSSDLEYCPRITDDSIHLNIHESSTITGEYHDYHAYNCNTSNASTLSEPMTITQNLLVILGMLLSVLCVIVLLQPGGDWTSHFQIMLSLMLGDMLVSASYVSYIFLYLFTRHWAEKFDPDDIP